MTPHKEGVPVRISMPQPSSYDVLLAEWLAYLGNALSQTVHADKIAVYRNELRRCGVRERRDRADVSSGFGCRLQFFPNVDALLSHRPKRPAKPISALSPRDLAEATAARKAFMQEVGRLAKSSTPGAPWSSLGPKGGSV